MSARKPTGYVVVFDDGRFAGERRYVTEYPDAKVFTSRKAAETHARKFNSPYTIETL